MNIETITTPVWGDKEHTIINCMVKFAELESPVPFTATEDDCEAHGREIFAACQRGDAGEIGKYVSSVTPEKARSAKTAEINAWRDSMESASYVFEFNGHRWDYGKETQARLEPSVAAARAGKLPEGFFWTDADNNDVPMTAEALIALSEAAQQAMFAKGLEIHLRQREMKKAVEALNDADAVLAYAVGWE
ncbi:DUF4376 domain-containing protein [Escherichia coli]|nr:DUF4376 domain-containing protein [Escherichia coli]